jgi:bifunctional N-acetylglucosamine-1-phosphate-uridyltransferase/glucosamine-1-phosphate-acetyltransferase GlmU-like protein
MHKQIIILAAGKGSRMNSDTPKPMQQVKNVPMLDRVIKAARKSTSDIILVHSTTLSPYLDKYTGCQFILQQEQLGTAHAVFCALGQIKKSSFVTVVYADHPFIDNMVIDKMFDSIQSNSYSAMTLASIQEEANSYGRIVCSGPEISQIVEYKNLSAEQKNIKLCNSALMSFAPGVLHQFLPLVFEQPKLTEYYLTVMVEILVKHGQKVSYVLDEECKYSLGVNTPEELKYANQSNF